MVFKWTFLFQGLIFRFHVKFRGCICKIQVVLQWDKRIYLVNARSSDMSAESIGFGGVYTLEDERLVPTNQPWKERKIIWTKPPWWCYILIFQGVLRIVYRDYKWAIIRIPSWTNQDMECHWFFRKFITRVRLMSMQGWWSTCLSRLSRLRIWPLNLRHFFAPKGLEMFEVFSRDCVWRYQFGTSLLARPTLFFLFYPPRN